MIEDIVNGADYWTIPSMVVIPRNHGVDAPWRCKVVGTGAGSSWVISLYSEADGNGDLNRLCFLATPAVLWRTAAQALEGFRKAVIGSTDKLPLEKDVKDWTLGPQDLYRVDQDEELSPFEDPEFMGVIDPISGKCVIEEDRLHFERPSELFLLAREDEKISLQEAQRRDKMRREERDAAREQNGVGRGPAK